MEGIASAAGATVVTRRPGAATSSSPAVPGPRGLPELSQKPISMWGPVEMPTMPGPTELITWPALTWVPRGSW